jgi:hypothetical protein
MVIAAKKALEADATTVMILGLDACCGGGTASLIQGIPDIRKMNVLVSGFDYSIGGSSRKNIFGRQHYSFPKKR